MTRTARHVVPNLPHHIVQRGNRKQNVFFTEDDYRVYLSLLNEQTDKHDLSILAYCLMPNHVHLIATPSAENLRPLGEVNRRYARYINKKMEWTGHLWQGRFASYPMDERYAYEAVRYVELNPVRAGICSHPTHYRWSSARQRIRTDVHDLRTSASAFLSVGNWESYWQEALERDDSIAQMFVDNEQAQKPLGLLAA